MEFEKIHLGDVATLKNGYAYKSKDFVEKGIPVVKIKNIQPPTVDINDCNYVSEDVYESTTEYSLSYGDILISMTGSGVNQMNSAVGKVGRVQFNDKALQNQRVGKIEIIDKTKYNSDFLFYYISQKKLLEYFVINSTGSANQANISKKIIENTLVPNISLDKQKKIGSILRLLDKKIEINNQIIENLESQAQAIFKSWFVDFEPFQDGNFVESELGLIPEGWIVKNIGDISKVKSGKRPNKKLDKGLFPIYGANGITGWTDEFLLNEPAIITGRVGTLGKLYRLNNEVWPSDNTLVFTSDDYELLYYNLRSIDYQSFNRGSTQPLISQRDIKNVKIVYPAEQELKKFSNIVGDIFDYINSIEKQNQTLAQTRDTLLPKLMSGEIDVSNIKIDEDIDYD